MSSFKLKKELVGISAEAFEGRGFTVEMSWQDASGEYSEQVTLPADGQEVLGPELPVGTEVTFTELVAPPVSGYDWEGVSWSPETVTIAEGMNVLVTVTNTYVALGTTLPVTGAEVLWILVGGSTLIAGGIAIHLMTRTRRSH